MHEAAPATLQPCSPLQCSHAAAAAAARSMFWGIKVAVRTNMAHNTSKTRWNMQPDVNTHCSQFV